MRPVPDLGPRRTAPGLMPTPAGAGQRRQRCEPARPSHRESAPRGPRCHMRREILAGRRAPPSFAVDSQQRGATPTFPEPLGPRRDGG
eukprot:3694941-Pyramimonas_sp.AAC.1